MPESGRKPQRTCIGCRKTGDKDRFVRYVTGPQGELLVDYREKLPGRGAYTCFDASCIAQAVKRGAFSRAFRGKVLLPAGAEQLVEELAGQTRGRIVSLLGMARKSGAALSGSNLVLKALENENETEMVLLAEDISTGIGAKVAAKADSKKVPCFQLLDKGLIGQILGKGERSVVALKKTPLTETIKREVSRYTQIVGES